MDRRIGGEKCVRNNFEVLASQTAGLLENRPQSQVCDEWVKISVAMQQDHPIDDAARCDDAGNGLAHRNALLPQLAEILCGLYCDRLTTKHNHIQRCQQPLGFAKVAIAGHALQHLSQDQVVDDDRLHAKQRMQPFRQFGFGSTEVVDPHAGVDQNQ